MNEWVDVSAGGLGYADLDKDGVPDQVQPINGLGSLFWFDYAAGRLFIKFRYLMPRFNAICISYRYGSEEPPPYGIRRLCNLIVASNIMNADFYSVKVGMGGDIGGIRDAALERWSREMDRLYSSFQRTAAIHPLW